MIDSMLLNPDSLIIINEFCESPFKIEFPNSSLPKGFTVYYSDSNNVIKITYTNKFGIVRDLDYFQTKKICNNKGWNMEIPIYKGYAGILFPDIQASDEDWIDKFIYNLSNLSSNGITIKNITLNLDILEITHSKYEN